jgi:hypothetical protein
MLQPQQPLYATVDETGKCAAKMLKSKEAALVDSVRVVGLTSNTPATRASAIALSTHFFLLVYALAQ